MLAKGTPGSMQVAQPLGYVVLSQCLRSCQVRTSIAEVDLAVQKLDHVAVKVDIPIEFSCCANRRRTFDFHAPTPVCDGPPPDLSGELMCIYTRCHTAALVAKHTASSHQGCSKKEPLDR